ncbi:MRP-L47-domain-containing protein [Fomitiporia mediterranea MF3/22]|uniref:MRP-L47-domain-containing protein n=1 Tax=Fomitiporia mediterranea (strain MF3/22) TaxID=694068 RepID=UPI0004408432|nr:MRP-L47-domain-containing protein [Fomitiporia mediterranea MF3/22]EJC98097.1 MRP-L47-domain-containing protein [Fomitiporia mediterranea MF3/22]
MLSALRLRVARRPTAPLANIRRWLATETSLPTSRPLEQDESEEAQRLRYEAFLAEKEQEPPTRPQLNIPVSPKHGLYAFFRQVSTEGGMSFEYETMEGQHKAETKKGRSWNAVELRRKSFKDLHTLWYIVLRERNLIATQRQEAKRHGIFDEQMDLREKDRTCRKTMARIKQVLNERRLAYEQAYALEYEKRKANEAAAAKNSSDVQAAEQNAVSESNVTESRAATNGRRPRRAKPRVAATA